MIIKLHSPSDILKKIKKTINKKPVKKELVKKKVSKKKPIINKIDKKKPVQKKETKVQRKTLREEKLTLEEMENKIREREIASEKYFEQLKNEIFEYFSLSSHSYIRSMRLHFNNYILNKYHMYKIRNGKREDFFIENDVEYNKVIKKFENSKRIVIDCEFINNKFKGIIIKNENSFVKFEKELMETVKKSFDEEVLKLKEEIDNNNSHIYSQRKELDELAKKIQESYNILERLKNGNFSLDT